MNSETSFANLGLAFSLTYERSAYRSFDLLYSKVRFFELSDSGYQHAGVLSYYLARETANRRKHATP